MPRKSYSVKILLGLWLWVALAACVPLPRPAQEPLAVYLERADQLAAEQHYSEAVETLEEGAHLYPETPLPLLKIGQIYLRQRRWLPARDAFNRALARELTQPVALAGLAEVMLNQGQPGEALPLWQQAVALHPNLAGVFTGLGRTHLSRLEFEAAREAFLQQQTRHSDPEAQWYLAALTAPETLSTARQYLLDIPAQAPAELLARRDYLLATLVPFTESSSQVEIARAVGTAFTQVEQWPLAIHALTVAQNNGKEMGAEAQAETLAFLGHALASLNRPAFHLFDEAKRLDPDSALPLYFYGIYLRRQGALNAAEGALRQAIELDPENVAVHLELAQTKAEQGDLAAAEAYFGSAVTASGDDPAIQLLRVKFYAWRGYQVAAVGIPAAEALIEADPNNAEAHELLGWMQFLSGQAAQAESSLRRAVELDPALVSAHYHLARYLTAQGDTGAAIAAYQRVVDLDNSNVYREQALKGLQQLRQQG